MGATSVLSAFAAETRAEHVPHDARSAALRQVIDCTGVAIAAASEEPARLIAEITREEGGTPEARLFGSGISTSVIQASWANGSLCHLLDFDDTGFSHPTACILPAALAIGEQQHVSGRDFLTAMVVGYEVFERLSVSARPYEPKLRARGYHPTSLYGAPAAAAAAGNLLKLDRTQMAVALGLAAASTSGLTQHFGTWGKGVQAGTAARAGVTGALMGQKRYWADEEGFEGQYGFFNAIHGENNYDLQQVDDELGERWAILDPGLTIKAYPACGANLRAIDATLKLRQEHGISFDQVEQVEVETHPDILNTVRFHAPTEGFRGKFSLDYCVAAAVLDGKVDLDSFSNDYCSRPEMREALGKVKLVMRPEWGDSYFERRRNPVTIQLTDGRSVSCEVEHPHGSLQDPMTDDEVRSKYRACARRTLASSDVDHSLQLLEGLEDVDDIGQLIDSLVSRSTVAQ